VPIPRFADAQPSLVDFVAASRESRNGETEAIRAAATERRNAIRRGAVDESLAMFRRTLARLVTAEDGLRERLALFWADHFTVEAKTLHYRHLLAPYVEEAIRPHLSGRFSDMLRAVVLHPVLLTYLDQSRSIGPRSRVGLRQDRGLNENLARELLELHTLGADGPYTQGDVRELAEALTGLMVGAEGEVAFQRQRAEPGAETVLGVTYPDRSGLEVIGEVLDDLAAHPATARHVARKLAAHFVADEPPEELVEALAATFEATGGDLGEVTGTLLAHPAAWAPERRKVKPPICWMASSLRALGLRAEAILDHDGRQTRRLFLTPLGVMGQPWDQPGGPDGWPDTAAAWITPQFMAGRIDWAMNRVEDIQPDLPDPRELVEVALGPLAGEAVAFAARAAERRSEGVGVVLASVDFMRR
jgi:uncharacterized protein (DUF1800 family)